MRVWLIVPVKVGSSAKSRLAGEVDEPTRHELSRRLMERTFAVLAAGNTVPIVVVTPDAVATAAAEQAGFDVVPDRASSHSEAVVQGVRWAIERGADAVATVASDLPLLRLCDVELLLRTIERRSVVLAPDRAGSGTNGLAVAPASVMAIGRSSTSEQPGDARSEAARPPSRFAPFHLAFGPDSFRRHLESATAAGLAVRIVRTPGLAVDLDRPTDLDLAPLDAR